MVDFDLTVQTAELAAGSTGGSRARRRFRRRCGPGRRACSRPVCRAGRGPGRRSGSGTGPWRPSAARSAMRGSRGRAQPTRMPSSPTMSTNSSASTPTSVPGCAARCPRWRRFDARTCDDRDVPDSCPAMATTLASTMVTIVVLVGVLVALGIALLVVGVRLVRATRLIPVALGPLEVMGERQWRRAGPETRAEVLAGARGTPPTEVEAEAKVDAEAELDAAVEADAVSSTALAPPSADQAPVDLAAPVVAESSWSRGGVGGVVWSRWSRWRRSRRGRRGSHPNRRCHQNRRCRRCHPNPSHRSPGRNRRRRPSRCPPSPGRRPSPFRSRFRTRRHPIPCRTRSRLSRTLLRRSLRSSRRPMQTMPPTRARAATTARKLSSR